MATIAQNALFALMQANPHMSYADLQAKQAEALDSVVFVESLGASLPLRTVQTMAYAFGNIGLGVYGEYTSYADIKEANPGLDSKGLKRVFEGHPSYQAAKAIRAAHEDSALYAELKALCHAAGLTVDFAGVVASHR